MSIINNLKIFWWVLNNTEYTEADFEKPTPCQSCGACCKYFSIKFDQNNNNHVPKEHIIKISKNINAMKGTDKFKGSCSAFTGEIGKSCSCTIYEKRPSVCRAFPIWLKSGRQNPKCYKARVFHGLPGKI